MKILVTGGAGFIGSAVVRHCLRLGYEVGVVDHFNEFYDPQIKRGNIADFQQDANIFEADIRDFDAMLSLLEQEKFDSIIHLAACAGVRPSIENPRLYIDTNITGTYNLLEAAQRAGTHHFLFASSSSVYGLAKTVPFSENLPLPQTLSPYAATKLSGEHLCGNFSNLYGMRVVCLRFFTVYGPGQRPDLAIHKFTRKIFSGEPIPKFGDGSTRRDYTYIDDIVQGIQGALQFQGPLFDIFNLGESETTSLNELIAHLEQAIGKPARIQSLPEQKGDMPLTCADITKARQYLGYHPTTPLAEGLPRFIEWFERIQGWN